MGQTFRSKAEPILFFLPGLLLLLANPYDHLQGWLTAAGASDFWLAHADYIARLLVRLAIVLAALAILSAFMVYRGGSLIGWAFTLACKDFHFLKHDLLPAIGRTFSDRKSNLWLAAVLLLGFAIRFYFMSQPMRFDESLTYVNFVDGPFRQLFHYPYPNNHVLHTLLVKVSTEFFGGAPAMVRLPALIFGIASMALFFSLCRMVSEGNSGFFGPTLTAVFPFLILFSTNARGYSMVDFMVMAMVVVGGRVIQNPAGGGAVILALLGAAGMLTIPVMTFPLAGLGLWIGLLALSRTTHKIRLMGSLLLPWVLLTLVFTFLAYLPVLITNDGASALLDNSNVRPQAWALFVQKIPSHLQGLYPYFTRGFPAPAFVFVALLAAIGFYTALRRREASFALLGPALLAGAVTVFLWKSRVPFMRGWIYFLPIAFLYADAGYARLSNILPRRFQPAVNGIVFAMAAFFSLSLARNDVVAQFDDTGVFPEASAVARRIMDDLEPGDAVLGKGPADFPVFFYLDYFGAPAWTRRPDADTKKLFIVVVKGRYEAANFTQLPTTLLMDSGNAALYVTESSQID